MKPIISKDEYEKAKKLITDEFYIDNEDVIRCSSGCQKGLRAYVGTCKKCGKLFLAKKKRMNCSRSCAASIPRPYMAERNRSEKMRNAIAERNKDKEFRKKVSRGLIERKKRLGENYHSKETKAKIGKATKERWEKTKEKILPILVWNGNMKRKKDGYPYNWNWQKLSKRLRNDYCCARCGSKENLITHHIIPARFGGSLEEKNAIVLCNVCHPTVERQGFKIYEIVKDWELTRAFVKSELTGELKEWNISR